MSYVPGFDERVFDPPDPVGEKNKFPCYNACTHLTSCQITTLESIYYKVY